MELKDIKVHWEDWAKTYSTNLRATTKTSTIKQLEIAAAIRAIRATTEHPGRILEVGCGNGYNCLSIAKEFGDAHVDGVDLIDDMIGAANQLLAEAGGLDHRVRFFQGDILELSATPVHDRYDIVFTDRCVINLPNDELQVRAIKALWEYVAPGGALIMIENSQQTHRQQNDCRQMVGLDRRTIYEFNHFFDDDIIIPLLESLGELAPIDDFGALHDLLLYVLSPAAGNGKHDYDDPLVAVATQLSLALHEQGTFNFGSFGQNRLYRVTKA